MEGQENAEQLEQRVATIFSIESTISLPINEEESVTVYKEDYESLLPYRWLRTQAVDVLIKLLLERCRAELRRVWVGRGMMCNQDHRSLLKLMDAFVATLVMTDQQDFILESLAPLDLFAENTKYLLIPLNTEFASGYHWLLGLLVRIGHSQYRLVVFDSGNGGMGIELGRRLQHLYQVLKKEKMEISVLEGENLVYQSNGYDCGVFAVGYSEYIMKEVVEGEEAQTEAIFNRLGTQYKYILGNSTHARIRYRRILEEEIVKTVKNKVF